MWIKTGIKLQYWLSLTLEIVCKQECDPQQEFQYKECFRAIDGIVHKVIVYSGKTVH
jgi:hypothetical protein